jgi:hypothetical protein
MRNSKVYTYLINNYDLSDKVVRIALEALALLGDESELQELLKEDHGIDVEEKENVNDQ